MNHSPWNRPDESGAIVSSIMFDVFERPLWMISSNGVTRQHPLNACAVTSAQSKAICRRNPLDEDMPLVLGIVGEGWNLVKNLDFMDAVESGIKKGLTDEALATMETRDLVSRGGAWTARDFKFPAINAEIDQGNGTHTKIDYRVIAQNAYDGSRSGTLHVGAIDGWCTNGMFIGQYDILRRRHTAGFKLPAFEQFVIDGAQKFSDQAKRVQKWAGISLTTQNVIDLLENLPGMSKRRANHFSDRFDKEAADRGASLWALYSALTFFASHDSDNFRVRNSGANDNVAESLTGREDKVLLWIKSPAWKAIEARGEMPATA